MASTAHSPGGLDIRADLEELRRLNLHRILIGLPVSSALLGFGYAAMYDRMPLK